ncbi:16722_t:CDS:2, partial [Cetraspora pellucida]
MLSLRSVPFLLAITIILFLTITTAYEDQINLDKRGYHQNSKQSELPKLKPKPIEHYQENKQHYEDHNHFAPSKHNSKPPDNNKFIENPDNHKNPNNPKPIENPNPEHKITTKCSKTTKHSEPT